MAVRKYPWWRTLYREARLERDPQQLPEKIARAEAAIYGRIKHLKASPKDQIDRRSLDEALASLGVMKKSALSWLEAGLAGPRIKRGLDNPAHLHSAF